MGLHKILRKIFKRKPKKISIPEEDLKRTLHQNLSFTATEQYKLLRANLMFTLPEDLKCPIIGVTSSMRGEGKSTTALNLSYALSESGKKVLLIDGDLRIPSVAKKLGLASSPGLTDFLINQKAMSLKPLKTDLSDKWYIMPSGDLPPNPSELLGSAKMERRLKYFAERFDYIIIDLPPVNLVSDALAISKYIDGMIVVVREEYTEKKELDACLRQLKLSNVRVLGCVLNDVDSGKGSYSKYKYRRYYKYYKYYAHYESGYGDNAKLKKGKSQEKSEEKKND